MKSRFSVAIIFILIFFNTGLKAQNKMETNQKLDNKQQTIVAISALTAKGDINQLKVYLGKGLELQEIDAADDLKISPFREDGVHYGTPTWIWEVVVNGNLYVRAYNGSSSSWHKSALKQKAGRIHTAGMVKEVSFEAVADSDLNQLIDEAYKKKYSKSPYLAHMISSAKSTTVRITPFSS